MENLSGHTYLVVDVGPTTFACIKPAFTVRITSIMMIIYVWLANLEFSKEVYKLN